jgi:plasmid stabilization system protein ParE
MTYRVDLTLRASRDLRYIFQAINAQHSLEARRWFNGLEAAILALDENPARNPVTPENTGQRQLLYASKSYVYRIIYAIDDDKSIVSILHIRHGSREPI